MEPSIRATIWKCYQYLHSNRPSTLGSVYPRLRRGAWNRADNANSDRGRVNSCTVSLDGSVGHPDSRKRYHNVLQREPP
jgi:hypothetical protein